MYCYNIGQKNSIFYSPLSVDSITELRATCTMNLFRSKSNTDKEFTSHKRQHGQGIYLAQKATRVRNLLKIKDNTDKEFK